MSTQQLDQKINDEKLIVKEAWQTPELTLRGQVKAVTSSNSWGGSPGSGGEGGHEVNGTWQWRWSLS